METPFTKQIEAEIATIKGLHDAYTEIASKITARLIKVLSLATAQNIFNDVENNGVYYAYVGHECGIPHTATDFSDEDENGVAKTKVIEYIGYNPAVKKLEALFEDGTKSTYFAIDDLAYLWDDLRDELEEFLREN